MQEIGIWLLVFIVMVMVCELITSGPSADHGDESMAGLLVLLFLLAGVLRFICLLITAWF